MDWTFRSDLPIYSQLVDKIKLGIISGEFVPGERLVSVRDMAMEAGVNPNTMQRALQELEREGLLFSQRTSGRFVTEDVPLIQRAKRAVAEERLRDFLGAMEKLGYSIGEILALLKEKEEHNEADSGV